jgi:dienelactone hydrolase
VACRPGHGEPASDAHVPYAQRRAAHETELRVDAPSPGRWVDEEPPPGVQRVTYRSGELELFGWFAMPDTPPPVPAVQYHHGDFAFGADDFERCRPFLDAGFAVFTPTLRGENGNPGRLELLYGEVDDAVAAAQWLAAQEGIDDDRIYAIGHSVGGAVAAMLSLRPEAPLSLTASVGGIYVPETFVRWSRMKSNAGLVRFDPTDRAEVELRTLGPNVADMVRPHLAYVGQQDRWFHANTEAVGRAAAVRGKAFEVVYVDGDHGSSLRPALRLFLDRVREGAP